MPLPDESFEREKLAFGHNTAQMRALNDQMSKVPPISITLTGGLWFAAAQTPVPETSIRFGLLLFAVVANIGLVLSCFRIRDVMQSYLEKIEDFSPAHFANGRPKKPILTNFSHYSMISVYAALMGCAAAMSFIGAFAFYWPYPFISRWIGVLVALGVICGALVALCKRTDKLS